MRYTHAFVFWVVFVVAASAPAATIVDVPCANELVIEAQGTGPDGAAFNYDQPVGIVVHTTLRGRERAGAPLVHRGRSHQRFTDKNATFEGLKGVVRHEFFVEGHPVMEGYTHFDRKTVSVWKPDVRRWERRPQSSFPDAADGRKFRVVSRTDAGVLDSVRHYRYEYVPELRCPWNGKVYRDLYALVLERDEAFDSKGQPKGDTGARSVTYYSRGHGPLWGYQSTNRIGAIAAPEEAVIDSDWFRAFDTNWPGR